MPGLMAAGRILWADALLVLDDVPEGFFLRRAGVEVLPRTINAYYYPADGTCGISLYGVTDTLIAGALPS